MLPSSTQSTIDCPTSSATAKTSFILLSLLAVIAVASMIFFTDLGKFPLFNPDEGLYAEPAREMLDTGEYITTLLNYVVRYTKPPLVIWIMAAAYKVFGVTEFAARSFEALSAVILVAVTYLFALRYAGKRTAILSALILCTSAVFIGTGREAITDMPLSLFIAGTLFSLYHCNKTRRVGWAILAYVLLGLAVMTKGPVALVLTVAIMLPFHILTGDLKQALQSYRLWLGIVLVSVISIPWYAVEIYKTHGEYFQQFIMVENVQRFTSVVDHKAPWWYHLAVVAGGLFPWTIFFPIALYHICKRTVTAFQRASAKPSTTTDAGSNNSPLERINALLEKAALWSDADESERLELFCAITGVVVIAFFSLAVSKLLPYTVPAFPAIAILIGATINEFINKKRWRIFTVLYISIAVIAVGSLLGLPIVAHKLRDCPPALLQLLPVVMMTISGSAIVAAVLSALKRISASVYTLAASIIVITIVFGFQILNMVSVEWEQPIKAFSYEYGPTKLPIIVFGMRKPSVTFYARRPIVFPKGEDELEEILQKTPEAVVLVKERDAKLMSLKSGATLKKRAGRYVIFDWHLGS